MLAATATGRTNSRIGVSSVGAFRIPGGLEYGPGNEWSVNPAMLLANHGRKRAGRRVHDSVELRSGARQIRSVRKASANMSRQRNQPANGQKILTSRLSRSTRPSSRSPRVLKIFLKIGAIGPEELWLWRSATTPSASLPRARPKLIADP